MKDIQHRTWLRPLVAWQTSLLLLSGSLLPVTTLAEAKSDGQKKHEPAAKHNKRKKAKGESATGLDGSTLELVNNGSWKEVVSRLEQQTAGDTQAGTLDGWLAFGYLFNNDCGKLDDLGKKLSVSQTTSPANAYAIVIAAFSQACHGQAEGARKTLASMPSTYANDVFCNFALAAVAGKQGLAGEAAAFLQRTTDLAPDFAWGYRTLAFLQQRWLKEPAKAEDSYLKALAIAPDLKEARDAIVDLRLAKNDFDGAVDISRQAIEENPKDPNNDYRLAQIFIQQWRLREAQQELDQAIKVDPQNAKFYRARASVKRYRGDLNAAILDQQRAVDLGQDKAFELVELAAMNTLAGNKNKAADNLEEALKLDPNNQSAHDKLVSLLEEEGRYEDLVGEYKRSLEKKPKDERLHLALGQAYAKLGKLNEAKAQFVEAQNLDQSDPEPHRQMGALFIKDKNFEKAAKEYTFVLNINPTSVQDMVSLGYCYYQNDDFMQAEAAYVTALALQQLLVQNAGPDRLEVMRSLANLLFNEGRYSDAASQYESIVAMEKPGADQVFDSFRLAQPKLCAI